MPKAFAIEGGPVCSYEKWREVVTQPNWLLLAIDKDNKLEGWMGIEKLDVITVQMHISLRRRVLTPQETRLIVVETGKYLFAHNIEVIRAVFPHDYKPAKRLAMRSGMTFSNIERIDKIPYDRYILTREEFMKFPERWN